MNENDLLQHITFNPTIINGKPIIREKRIEAQRQEPFK